MCVYFLGDWKVLNRNITVYKVVTEDEKSPVCCRIPQSMDSDRTGKILSYKKGTIVNGGLYGIYCYVQPPSIMRNDNKIVKLRVYKGTKIRYGGLGYNNINVKSAKVIGDYR